MSKASNSRAGLSDARRVVVKIGTRSILGASPPRTGRFRSVATQMAALRKRGHRTVLVSSGAVAMGFKQLGFQRRPAQIAELQACAAIGQSKLVRAYEDAFAVHDIHVAQVLLTHEGLADRPRYLKARATLEMLLDHGAVPIINENDTVSVEEIKFGDNDRLAALVATLIGADLLVLLTDVDGLLDASGERVSEVHDLEQARALVRPIEEGESLGGMESKLEAAKLCARRGLPMVIASAADSAVLQRIVGGEDVGTLFLPHGETLASRKHWIAYTLKARGSVVVDGGAVRALRAGKRSLLPAGVVEVHGQFRLGDAIRIVDAGGHELGRGLARYDAKDVRRLAGVQSADIEACLGHYGGAEIIHRDDMVVYR